MYASCFFFYIQHRDVHSLFEWFVILFYASHTERRQRNKNKIRKWYAIFFIWNFSQAVCICAQYMGRIFFSFDDKKWNPYLATIYFVVIVCIYSDCERTVQNWIFEACIIQDHIEANRLLSFIPTKELVIL